MKNTISTAGSNQRRRATGATLLTGHMSGPGSGRMASGPAGVVSGRAAGFSTRALSSPPPDPGAVRPGPERAAPVVSPGGPCPAAPAPGAAQPTDARSSQAPGPGFHGAVSEFKRRLIQTTLTQLGGNRTRTARALGLQRTYLLRLMREFEINVPATLGHPRRHLPDEVPLPPRPG